MNFLNGMVFGTGTGLITVALAGLAGKVPDQLIYILVAIGAVLVIAEVGRYISFKPSHKAQRPLS